MKYYLFFIVLSGTLLAANKSDESEKGYFTARVSKVNRDAEMIRIKIDFDNVRFLNKKDQVEIWLNMNATRRCTSSVLGKTNDYILLKVPNFERCNRRVPFTVGAHIKLYSEDLAKNIKVAGELNELLLKKRVAVNAKLSQAERVLGTYVEKVEAINSRYQVLKEKLELEWQDELSRLEEDRATFIHNYEDLKIRLNEIDHKLEQYRIEDSNLKYDRWSLDPQMFTRK